VLGKIVLQSSGCELALSSDQQPRFRRVPVHTY